MHENERAAHQYADAGWPVFPLLPGRKEPATTHGYLDASADHRDIERGWRRQPESNVGLATGAPGPDVLDVDVKFGAPGPANLNIAKRAGLVPEAATVVRTPSNGFHLYYLGDDQPSAAREKLGLDFRAHGGYVLAPPSSTVKGPRTAEGTYVLDKHGQLTPPPSFQAIRELLEPRPQRSMDPWARGEPSALSDAARGGIWRYVAETSTGGGWSHGLYWAGCRYGESGASEAEALAELAEAAQPWNAFEAKRAEMHIRNGWERGQASPKAPQREREAGA